MKLHTTPKRVEAQLNARCAFSDETVPSIHSVNNWIREVSDELNSLTEDRYNQSEKEEILDWFGETDKLLTSHAPISDVTVYYNNAGIKSPPNWVLLEEFIGYLVDPYKGRIILQEGGAAAYKTGRNRFKVQYTSGTEDTPYWLRNLATRMVVKNVVESTISGRGASSEGASQVRMGQVVVTSPSDFGVSNYRALVEGIEKDLDGLRNQSRGVRYVNYR